MFAFGVVLIVLAIAVLCQRKTPAETLAEWLFWIVVAGGSIFWLAVCLGVPAAILFVIGHYIAKFW
jgi:hypothetical protein